MTNEKETGTVLKHTRTAIFLTCSCLLHIPQAALADSPWQCQKLESGLWDCADITKPDVATAPAKKPVSDVDTPAIIKTTTDSDPSEVLEVPPETPAASPDINTVAPVPVKHTADTPPVAEQSALEQPAQPVLPESAQIEQLEEPAQPEQPEHPEQPAMETALPRASTTPPLCPSRGTDTLARDTPDFNTDGPIQLDADRAEISNENLYSLEGNAVIHYGTQTLQADKITYSEAEGTIKADGAIRLANPTMVIEGSNAQLSTKDSTGKLENISYHLPARYAHGTADQLELKSPTVAELDNTSFTTCPEGNNDWQLTASKITLDQGDGTGQARDARLTFKGVPILYSPIVSFPIDDRRKSGFLVPRLGSSDETGVDISTPWYWDIAPNRDATITPRIMTSRGFMLGSEFRYLNERNQGQFGFEYLPSDDKFDNEDRSLFSIQHDGKPFDRLVTHISAIDVSDDEYFRDLGGSQLSASRTHLERTAGVTYHGDAWSLFARVQDYQTVDATLLDEDEPYKRLPQIYLDISPEKKLKGVQFSMNSELTRFDQNNRVTGTRLDLQPRFNLPIYRSGWFVDPSVSVRHTRYSLDDVDPGDPDSLSRTTPIVSIDAGSFFERDIRWGDTDLVQTLEPRIYYLHVPFEDQTDIPIFDTGEYDFNFWQLFKENRFSGGDRMGDANQLALALTSRLINPANGLQQISASVGELFYFRDRRVTLPGEAEENSNSSDLVADLDVQFNRNWQASAGILWDTEDSSTGRSNVRVQYRTDERKVVNLGYRFRQDVLEQTETSFLWPLNPNWHVVGRWNYSLSDDKTLNALTGIGYESCCWGLQLVGRSYVNDDDGSRNTSIYLQFELKGLVGLGSKVDSLLEHDIQGYY